MILISMEASDWGATHTPNRTHKTGPAGFMNTETHPTMTPILEGGEAFIEKISQYLKTENISNTIDFAEDCQPDA